MGSESKKTDQTRWCRYPADELGLKYPYHEGAYTIPEGHPLEGDTVMIGPGMGEIMFLAEPPVVDLREGHSGTWIVDSARRELSFTADDRKVIPPTD